MSQAGDKTAEQIVKEKWPDAYIAGSYSMTQAPDDFDVMVRSIGKCVGSGHTPSKAWADAANKLDGRS